MIKCTLTRGLITPNAVGTFFSANLSEAQRFAVGMANDRLKLKLRYPATDKAACLTLKQYGLHLITSPCTLEEGQQFLDELTACRLEREAALFATYDTVEER